MKQISLLGAFFLLLVAIPVVSRGADGASEKPRFHHIHINSMDPHASGIWYRKYFDAVPVMFHGVADAVLTDRSYILYTKVDKPPATDIKSAIWHIGWGGVDGPSDFKWRKDAGVEFETPLTALGANYYMYAKGPDGELIEVWTGYKHHRFGHIHLFAEDVNAASHWYIDNLALETRRRDVPKPDPNAPATAGGSGIWSNQLSLDNIIVNVFGKPAENARWFPQGTPKELEPTKGRVVDHIAFSYRKIEPVFEKMKSSGVEIVEPIKPKPELGIKSFFVMGPDKVLVEIVEDKPIPEGLWDEGSR